MDGIEDSNENDVQKSVNQGDIRYKRPIKPDLDFNIKNNPEPIAPRPNVERYKNRITERRPATALSNNDNNSVNVIAPISKVVARVMVFYTDNTFDTFEAK